MDVDTLAASVPDGSLLALPPDNSLPPCAFVHALVRRGVRGLRLLGVPVSGYVTDVLIGAGCVASVQTSAVTLGEAGMAPRFTAAVAAGTIEVIDATCPAIHTMLQAAEKGVPFMPLRGVLGSDLVAHRPDWRVMQNPFGPAGDDILLLPALSPDIAAFHAVMADRDRNVWVGRRRELATIAHASRRVLVTVERIVEGSLLDDERLAPGVISGTYIDTVAIAERGAWPIALLDEYAADPAQLRAYAKAARTEVGFQEYLALVLDRRPAAAE